MVASNTPRASAGRGARQKEVKDGWQDMRQLKWSRNEAGTLNGKVGPFTLFTIAYYPQRGYFVAPKLPGLTKTILVNSEEAGQKKAEALYQRYFDFLKGAEWDQEPSYTKATSRRAASWKKTRHPLGA
jgi:hypothetical protein